MKSRELQSKSSLHAKTMVFISLIFSMAICASSLVYVDDFKQNYLEAIEWRSVTLAQSLRVHIESRYNAFGTMADPDLILESAYLECKKLFEANRHMHVAFVCVLDSTGHIVTHNNKEMWGQAFDYPGLRSVLDSRKIDTILLGDTYHTLVPVVAGNHQALGTIDVGFPRQVVRGKLVSVIQKAAILFLVLFITCFFSTWLFVSRVVIRPINRLIHATSNIARGDLTQNIQASPTREFNNLAVSLGRMRDAIGQSMADLEQKNQEVNAMIACSPVALFSLDLSGFVVVWAASAQRVFGWPPEEVIHLTLPTVLDSDKDLFDSLLNRSCQGEVIMGFDIRQRCKDGSVLHSALSLAPIRSKDHTIVGVMGSVADVTERVEKDRAHQKMQAQLIQAQKMESVGRLAGGVAHDYNNTLGVILGYAELVLESLLPNDPRTDDLQEIINATLHSADITRQLLAFARKQTIAPRVLDLNIAVENMLKMLRRLIGENIVLEWLAHNGPATVKMDTVQIDQILANLCVNAKDAIQDTGKIIIETRLVTIDSAYCQGNQGFRPGEFVCLTVSDNGSGMDQKTREKIFEPFFTSKKRGEGTGLGLATVYGIVKQNSGFINVYSEPGKGTTFNLYFDRHRESGHAGQEQETGTSHQKGKGETILLVEDETAILKIIKQTLEVLGYQVLCASTPADALELARANKDEISLLITDVILPDMNGKELCSKILGLCPGLKVIYMSGYTSNVIASYQILDDDIHFLQKPFSKKDFSKKVRKVLDL